MSEFQFFMPIAKVDKEKRTVSGYASTPTKDGDGEIVTLDAIRGALPDYMTYGNIREMHKLNAVGVAEEANIDTKGLFLTAKIVDDSAWEKCLEGVYKGFSIGGRKLSKTGNKITEIEMTEISVVDRPANPDCRISLAKSAKHLGEAQGHLLKAKTKGDGFSAPAKPNGGELGQNDANDDANITRKTEDGPSPCEPHGKINCEKCAAAKAADPAAEVVDDAEAKKKKAKKIKKMAKAKLAAAFGLGADSFLDLRKSMSTAGSLAYCFESIRSAQRSLMMEGKREGGDKKDQALAGELGTIAKDLANVISRKATHEGAEALDLSDADDMYVNSFLGEGDMSKVIDNGASGDPLADAVASLMKRAAMPSRAARMAMAADNVKKSRKACKAAKEMIEEAHKMHKAAYIAKASGGKREKDDDGDFDHADAMGKLQKAYAEISKARTMAKAASAQIAKALARSGERGQMTTDADAGFFTVPAGVTELTPDAMSGAAPGSKSGGSIAPAYPTDGSVYPGKAQQGGDLSKFAKNGMVSTEVAELMLKQSKMEGELEALRRIPASASGGRRPMNFDMTKVMGGTNNNVDNVNKALFDGVNMDALSSNDDQSRTEASAKVLGNFILSGHFGKSVFDPAFKGAAGAGR